MKANLDTVVKIQALARKYGKQVAFYNPLNERFSGILEFEDLGDIWKVVYLRHDETEFVCFKAYFNKSSGERAYHMDTERVRISRTIPGLSGKKNKYRVAETDFRRIGRIVGLTHYTHNL